MDITKFCGEEGARYPIDKPWVKDGWRYATDARIAVREPTDEPDSGTPMYEIVALFAARADAGCCDLVPTHDGKGTDQEEPACLVAEDPPKACKDYGKCPVAGEFECKNTTKYRTLSDIHFAGKKWGGHYIDLINKELPGAHYTLNVKGWLVFRLGKVEGILPCLKK